MLIGIAVAVALVVFVAPFANSNPDGLEKVSADTGIDAAVLDHDLADSPLADYGVDGVDNDVSAPASPASSASWPRSPSAPAWSGWCAGGATAPPGRARRPTPA